MSSVISAAARRVHDSPAQHVWLVDFTDGDGRLCAIVEVTLANAQRRDHSERESLAVQIARLFEPLQRGARGRRRRREPRLA